MAVMSHSPLLLPNIGKDYSKSLQKTLQGIDSLIYQIHNLRLDSLIIISSHGASVVNKVSINLSETYQSNLREFGDLSQPIVFSSDLELISRFCDELLHNRQEKLNLTHSTEVDYGVSVPLILLSQQSKLPYIVPVVPTFTDYQTNYDFGKTIQSEILNNNKRIGVLISGDLSHRMSKISPSGYSVIGKKYNERLINLILEKRVEDILNIKNTLIDKAHECVFYSLLIGFGILEDMNYTPKLVSYESVFGIGYVNINFEL